MKLKTATRIQNVAWLVIWLVMLPFGICGLVLTTLAKPFEWVVDQLDGIRFRIGNRLLRMSEEANDGTIQNEYCLRNYTASLAYEQLKKEKNDK